jgi:hypothetical protein
VGPAGGNLRVDTVSTTSPAATILDYDLVYSSTPSVVQITWGGTNYPSLADFKTTGQEAHGLEADPLFASPAPVAERPPAAPYNVSINIGNYHIKFASPAIDSANSDAPNEKNNDLDGTPRVDIPEITNTGAGLRDFDDRGVYEFFHFVSTYLPLWSR